MKFTKNQQGAISIFLSIILLCMFVFSAVIVDGGRIYAGKNIVSGAGQLALNSGLSTYDEALKDAYGLIAMSENVDELEENLNEYFVASLGTCGISEDEYNTALVFLQMAAEEGAFDAKAVPNTEVCRGYVMEQQVLDYMKYRAPITVSTGILDKIKSAKDMEQTKIVADKELETSKAANNVQRQLEDLKELIDYENEWYNTVKMAFSVDFAEMKENAQRVTAAKILYEDYLREENVMETGAWEEDIKAFLKEYDVATGIGLSHVSGYIAIYDSAILAKKYHNGLKDVTKDQFMEYWRTTYNIPLESELQEGEGEGDEETELSESQLELIKEGEKLYDNYVSAAEELDTLIFSHIPSDIKIQLQKIQDKSREIYKAAEEGKRLSDLIVKKCAKIREKLAVMQQKLGEWEKESGKLSSESLRKSNEENQRPYKELVDPDKEGIGELEKQAEKNAEFYEALRLTIGSAKFATADIRQVLFDDVIVGAEIASHANAVSSEQELSNFVHGNPFTILYTLCDVKERHDINALKDLTELEFYDYLEKACGKDKKTKKIESSNTDLKGQLSDVMKELKTLMTTDDLKDKDGNDLSGKLGEQSGSLPTTLMGAGEAKEKKVDTKQTVDIDDTDKRDDTLNMATKTLNSDNSLMKNITKIADKGLESIIEPVYITEYFTTMYSYYTINKTGEKDSQNKWQEKNAADIVSLSNYDLTQDVIYRAEVEYILWGNKTDARKNVNTTKAVIFAIQFVGNLTYALTQKEVTAGAKQVASFFPHKIVALVVQVVVEVVVATVETVRDMVVLCNGGSVVPFKIMTQGEWRSEFNSIDDIKKWDMTKDKTSKKIMAFSYKDYLWIMLCANCLKDETRYKMLERAADLTQVNLAKSEGEENYKLMNKSTMLQINANVEMDAWLVTDLFKNNSTNTGLDTSGKYTLKYRGIQGY